MIIQNYLSNNPPLYDYKIIYGTLPKSDEFNEEYKKMIKNGWQIDGPTSYVATPPTGKIVCIQRFKRLQNKNNENLDTTHG